MKKTIYFQEDASGLTIFGTGYTRRIVPKSNPRYSQILAALREKAFDKIDGLIAGTNTPVAQTISWPFPHHSSIPTRVNQPAPAVKTVARKNPKVYIYNNGNLRVLVRTRGDRPNNEMYDITGVFICTNDNKCLKALAARTRSVERLLLRLPKAERASFYISDADLIIRNAKPAHSATKIHVVLPAVDVVAQRVAHVIAMELGLSDAQALDPMLHLVNDLGADSLDLVELCMALEDEFGYDCPDEDAEKISTVGQILDYVRPKLKT